MLEVVRAAGGADVCGYARTYVQRERFAKGDPFPLEHDCAWTPPRQSDICPDEPRGPGLPDWPKSRLSILSSGMQSLFRFPNPVNEKASRVVAGTVLVGVIVTLATGFYWLLIPITYGFWARVLTGPTLSPLGWIAQNVIAPRLGERKPVPGPPKRFAQGIGAFCSTLALVLAFAVLHTAADVVLFVFLPAAGLESIVGYCVGCKLFALLMRLGVIPERVCLECADLGARLAA